MLFVIDLNTKEDRESWWLGCDRIKTRESVMLFQADGDELNVILRVLDENSKKPALKGSEVWNPINYAGLQTIPAIKKLRDAVPGMTLLAAKCIIDKWIERGEFRPSIKIHPDRAFCPTCGEAK